MAYSNRFRVTALAAAIAGTGAVAPAYGFEYTNDDFRLQVDSTFSLGASWRASDVDYRNVGLQNALAAQANGDNPSGQFHKHGSSTADDGDLMWKKGSTFSEVAKLTVDMELNYRNFGAFIRGKSFYDNRIVNGDGVTDLPEYYWQDDQGRNRSPNQSSGASGDILDAFVWGDWDMNGHPLNVRFGKQVINWGEGLLFANGINNINPVDVSALLAPGSEVKDALIPLNSLYGSVGVTNALSLEAFMLFDWRETELPNCGTFFSQSDLVGPGCWAGFVPSGMESSFTGNPLTPLDDAINFTLPRGADQTPDSDGQYGVAARYFVESIETEFGVYYTNLHSNLPVISGHTPDVTKLGFPTLQAARTALVGGTGNPLATIALLPLGDYFVEYPEDIQMFGASFSTSQDLGLPGGATAISGEISMRKDQPFALEDGDALSGAVGLPSLGCWDAPTAYDCYTDYAPGEYKAGYVQKDYFQAEMVFIHFFDQVLGASRWTAVVDIAGSYLDLPSKSQALLNSNYNATLNHPWAPNVPTIAGLVPLLYPQFIDQVWQAQQALPVYARSYTVAPEGDDYFPTSGAWGYKLRFSGDYEDVFAGINLRPTISFSHDVDGTTPTPIANFLEDRKAIGLSLEAVYLNDYSVNIGYTDFYGAEPYNSLADRDYYSLSTTISF